MNDLYSLICPHDARFKTRFCPSGLPSNPDDSAIALRRGVILHLTLHPATTYDQRHRELHSQVHVTFNSVSVIFDMRLYNCNANPNY